MTGETLYQELIQAYTDENLNRITAQIITLYKSKFYAEIKRITQILSDYITFDEDNMSKCFTKLVMTFHPDKGIHYRNEIEKLFTNGKHELLNQYSHILKIQNLKIITETSQISEDIDYHPEYEWDYDKTGYGYQSDDNIGESDQLNFDSQEYDNSFFSAVKRKMYGHLEVDMPYYYLEDLEKIDMAEYEIETLEGIEYCKHTRHINLSRNYIYNISELCNLRELEELYISQNQIGYIDSIAVLRKLRIIDLSYNQINDISPLFNIPHLEFVNVIGNKISKDQIEHLQKNDVVVVY